MKDIALVVFDMAGTTIEDSGQVPEAFTTVLRKHGIEIDDEALRAVRGASKRDAIRHFVSRQSIELCSQADGRRLRGTPRQRGRIPPEH